MRGGYRPGAGRRKLTDAERDGLDKLRGRLPELVDVLLDRALGHREVDSMGRVYTRSPDLRAAIYLVDRVLGKIREEAAVQSVDVAALVEALRGDGQRTNSS
jgi:tRNA A-37 threonylcarbamoyl transferase component Bud32